MTMGKKKVKAYVKRKHVPESKIIEDLLSKYSTIDVTKTKKFCDLPLSRNTLRGLTECDYVEMTDIQRQSIGFALQGNDILGAAKTGSGKTLAFLIPVLEALYCKQWTRLDGLGALIITPTRELAYQIYETLRKIGHYHDVSGGLIIGGKDLNFEKKRLDQCNIVICTPGRLLQHMDENRFSCENMQILVLDEADRCLDMGFEKTMNAIIENLPPERQTLLFSATQTKSVKDLARLSLKDPLYVSVHEHSAHTTPEGLQQSYIVCALEDKMAMLWSFIRNHLKQKMIIFFSSCKQVKYVYEVFCRMRPGVSLLALYGTLHQLKRLSIYESFCRKQHAVLFATDIASRGLDFPAVNWVIQMDCPEDVNAYIHRVGRTARFKSGGESLLVLLPSEEAMVEKLEQRKIPINMIQINPNKLQSPHRKLEALLAASVPLKESAQRAFVAYIKSVYLMKDKEVFNVHALNKDLYANSLGLAVAPKIRFLQRIQKKMATSSIKAGEETDKSSTKLAGGSEEANDEDDTDVEDIPNTPYQKKEAIAKDAAALQFDVSDDDDDVLTIKRKNIDIDDISVMENDKSGGHDKKASKKKPVTRIALAKKILKKKIVANKKVVFDEDGQEIIDSAKANKSELARQYENEVDSGINIEIAKQILREEDQFDKERYREMLKEKRREQKRKLKAAKKAEMNDEEEDVSDNDNVNEDKFNEGESSGDESSEGPDLSWLPDPDKIYGKQQTLDEEETSVDESEQDKESEEESAIHRSSKRKSITQEEHKRTRKKQKVSDIAGLKADEELALQLLQN
ncbi:putative ATP-dependent RNA helicase DDX10 [Ooceraea biroi]|uniref:ATP-dependent RNA helicase n=1 Tax=Ooceraea biroi TaxID=2015173 RepID=A0A026X045_OOCBI|nr:putative ATP-dependent RNA helicase DDX10 [Ooceraea biroi]